MVKGCIYYVIMLVTEKAQNNNNYTTMIYKFLVFTGKVKHVHTMFTSPIPSEEGSGDETTVIVDLLKCCSTTFCSPNLEVENVLLW